MKSDDADLGIQYLLEKFESMYPYLQHIAHCNGIRDPFNDRVVEAYWLGNALLDQVRKKDLYVHLSDGLRLRTRMNTQAFTALRDKIGPLSVPHHAFHVFHVWQTVGWKEKAQTLDQLDNCRVSVGKVLAVDGPWITVHTRPIISDASERLSFGQLVQKKIARSLGADMDIDCVQKDDLITIHWGVPCEIITTAQARNIEKYTQMSLDLANKTIFE